MLVAGTLSKICKKIICRAEGVVKCLLASTTFLFLSPPVGRSLAAYVYSSPNTHKHTAKSSFGGKKVHRRTYESGSLYNIVVILVSQTHVQESVIMSLQILPFFTFLNFFAVIFHAPVLFANVSAHFSCDIGMNFGGTNAFSNAFFFFTQA